MHMMFPRFPVLTFPVPRFPSPRQNTSSRIFQSCIFSITNKRMAANIGEQFCCVVMNLCIPTLNYWHNRHSVGRSYVTTAQLYWVIVVTVSCCNRFDRQLIQLFAFLIYRRRELVH